MPTMPPGAGVPQPVDDAQRLALSLFLAWTADVVDTAHQLAERAELARAACPKTAAP